MKLVKISKMAKCEVGMFKQLFNWWSLWAKCKVTEFANLLGLSFNEVLHLMEFFKLCIYQIMERASLWNLLDIEVSQITDFVIYVFYVFSKFESLWSVLVMVLTIYEVSLFMQFVIYVFNQFFNVVSSWELSVYGMFISWILQTRANSKITLTFNPLQNYSIYFGSLPWRFANWGFLQKLEVTSLWNLQMYEFANLEILPFMDVRFWEVRPNLEFANLWSLQICWVAFP